MPPKSKSSASSATRKKHARKAAAHNSVEDDPPIAKEKKPKGKDRKNKKEPRKKVYIPPIKPPPVQPDPLDALGLAQTLPPELLVVLRRLSKKDSITKRRALEELQTAWLSRVTRGEEREYLVFTLQQTIPVWLHHLPTLFLHPSRRIRLQAVGLHTSFLQIPDLRAQIFLHIREAISSDQVECVLGSWCLAAYDWDRQVSTYARESWNAYISTSTTTGSDDKLVIDTALLPQLWEFVQRILLDPIGVYLYINPPQPTAPASTLGKKGSGRGTPVRKDEEPTRAKVDEDEENEQDRKARLRVSAFGGTEWVLNARLAQNPKVRENDEFFTMLANPALWSSLYYGKNPPFVEVESFGFEQPLVRRSAWALLQTLVQKCKNDISPLLFVLSGATLRSAWVEPDATVRTTMWQPLLQFLRHFPGAWTTEGEVEADDSQSDSDEEDAPKTIRTQQRAFREFLQFLATGCSGSPLQGYPTVLVVLSTVPAKVMADACTDPLEELFTSFWAAVDARVLNSLDRVAASKAFLSSVLECLVLMVRRVHTSSTETCLVKNDQTAPFESLRLLIKNEVVRAWEELSSGRLKVGGRDAGKDMANAFASLHKLSPEYFDVAWNTLSASVESCLATDRTSIPVLVPELLKQLSSSFEKGTAQGRAAESLILVVIHSALAQCSVALDAEERKEERIASLVNILDNFSDLLFTDTGTSQMLDNLVQRQAYLLLTRMPSLLWLYLHHRADERICSAIWHEVLEVVVSHPDEFDMTLSALLDATESGRLPTYIRPHGEELHTAAGRLLAEALSAPPNPPQVSLIRRLLHSYEPFISRSCHENLLRSLVDAFVLHFDSVLHDEEASLSVFTTPLNLMHSLVEQDHPQILLDNYSSALFPYIFLLVFLLPQFCGVDGIQKTVARSLWEKWLGSASEEAKVKTWVVIKHLLRELLADFLARPTPEQILRTISGIPANAKVDLLSDIFPPRSVLDSMLDALPPHPLDGSLAVIDPLIPPPSLYSSSRTHSPEFDRQGLQKYARIVYGLILCLVDDRQTAKENAWALHHFFALTIYAEEYKHLPFVESPLFSKSVSRPFLQSILDKVQQLATYLLSSTAEEQWHTRVTGGMLTQAPAEGLDGIGQVVTDLINRATQNDPVRESRVLHLILRHALSTATKADAEQWMLVARKIEKLAPHTTLAIVFSVTRYAPEPTRLVRYRNELAAGTLGIPPSKANTEGLWLLRYLAAAAPDPDSDIVFLPQSRAVNLVKACQQWITSDEDLEEDVQSEMTLVFASLVPLLANVSGAHWDLMFDVIENNLENVSLADPTTYTTLNRTLQLFITVDDFASTNKSLKAVWEPRRSGSLTLIRDLVSLKLVNEHPSTPLSVCRERALQIVQDLPSTILTRDTLKEMCHLLMDGSVNVQRMSYQLLQEASKKYTEELVIEAAVDTEGIMKPELPDELLSILQRSLNHEDTDTDQYSQEWYGYLLAWMVTLDLFIGASLKVKSGYVDQLKDLALVGDKLVPTVLGLLDLYNGMAKAFKLDIWEIDEFYMDSYSPDTPLSLRLLAAHLYYRALLLVPSLIRGWLEGCRDRQLSTTVAAYTSRYLSPTLIQTQLARVREPSAAAELLSAGDGVAVKVAGAINEVTASYAVDDQQLELTVRLPADWPLHTIEIKDSRLVGVTEEKWRAWVLGVQQILTFRSGSIVDGLSFFLKNVASHFEGMAECAICYSVLNATDGSLPRKPCKTCKNRFHAACLYKWFNTSHSTSCPLCRSEIMTGR